MTRVFHALTRLYPAEHRNLFDREMLTVFNEAASNRREQGRAAFTRFVIAELVGLVIGIPKEWMMKFADPQNYAKNVAELCEGVPQSSLPAEMVEAQQRVELTVKRMVHAIAHHQFEDARRYSREERTEREILQRLREKYQL